MPRTSTQEVFVSALRRMRETERPIAFKPWIYEIAKNACIDQFRRSRRTEEVSLEADEGLAPADYGRLVGSDPAPHDAVETKQELTDLCGAFGGLSDAHHEILLLRELEGLSYREIGDRMGMSRPAVESTLFRARRRLTEEYDELVTGARCQRVQSLIATAAETRLGTRESRRLRGTCRIASRAAARPWSRGWTPRSSRTSRCAGAPPRRWRRCSLWFLSAVRAAVGVATARRARSRARPGPGWMAHVPMLSEQISGGWGKLAAAAAVWWRASVRPAWDARSCAGDDGPAGGTRAADQRTSPRRARARPRSRSLPASGRRARPKRGGPARRQAQGRATLRRQHPPATRAPSPAASRRRCGSRRRRPVAAPRRPAPERDAPDRRHRPGRPGPGRWPTRSSSPWWRTSPTRSRASPRRSPRRSPKRSTTWGTRSRTAPAFPCRPCRPFRRLP